MATKPENVNPFAKYVEQSGEVEQENPFAKFITPEQPSELLDPAKMFASGVVGPTAAIPMGIESAVRNIPRQVVEQQGIAPVDKIGPLTFAKELVRTGPAQLLTNTARAFIKKATGESFEEQQEKQKQNEITIDRAISNIPRVYGLSQLADAGKKVSEDLRESVSAAGQKAIEDSQVEGNILESIQNRSVDNLSFGKDPSFKGYALQASQVLGSLVPIIGTAVMTKGNAKAVGTVGFGMGAGEAVQDATEYVGKLSDEQLMQSSPYFKKMVEDGVDPAEARKVVTDKAAEYAAQLQGSVAAFGGVITGKLITGQFDKLITGPVKNRLGRIALGVTAGSLEEGTQEFLEGVAKDLGINKTVIKEIGEESFANFVLGSIGGAGPGAYRGAVAKKKEEIKAVQPKVTKEQQDAEMLAALSGQPLAPEVTPVDPSLAVTPAAVPSAIITEEDIDTGEGLTPVSPTPPPVTPAAVTPTVAPTTPTPTPPAAPVAATAEIAQRIEELDAELKQIDAAYATATPDQFGELNARQGEIKSEISRLFQAGTTGAPITAVTPIPTEAAAPPAKTPKFAEDETGKKLSYPMFVDMADKGYKLYSFENPRTYENKGGVRYRTLEKDGVRLALEPQQVLFTDPKKPNQQPQLGMGDENDVAFHFIGVDPDLRKQGKARQAIQDLVEIADKNNFTLYGEPAQLEKDGMTKDQLLDFYKQFGFEPTNDTNKVIVREPGAKAIPVEKPKELVGTEKKLDDLIKNKDSIVKQMAENYKISQEYAAKAYDAELEYTRAASRAYGDHPNKISEKDFKAAIKKHDNFFNRLKGVSSRAKEKEAAAPVEAKKTQAEINRERQAEKKAAAEKAKQPVDTSGVKDLIEGKIKKVLGWTVYKRKEDPEFWYVQSPENHAENRIGQGDDVSTNLDTARSRIEQHIADAEYDARKAAEKPVEKKAEKPEPVKAKPAEKQLDLKAPKLNQEWAEFKSELTEKPSSLTSEVYDQYTRFKAGNFSVPTATFTGAEAKKRTNEYNKQAKEIYDKAAREFLNRSISIKPPTKNQEKLQIPDNLLAVPPPITKAIKGKAETIDQQKKTLLSIAAPKSDPRAAIKGILVEPDKMVSTDGHRMAILLTNTNVPETVILDKDNKPIDSSYPAYDRVADQAKNAKLVAAVNATALGDYARGVNKAQKYVDNAKSPFMFRIDGQNYIYDGQYVEDLANLFRQFGYDEFNVGLASEKNNMLVAKSPDGKLTQYLMGVRDDRNIYMPFEVSTGEPGYSRSDKEGKPADKPYYNDFTSNIDSAELIKRIQNDREETIKEYAQTRAASRRALKKIAKYGSDIPMQRNLNDLLEKEEILKSTLDATKPIRNSAADFMAKATDEMADKNLAPEVEAVIRQVYQKYPAILEGLRLSLRTRKAGGTDAGNFNPHARMVTLWKDSSGVDNPATIRHELTHSLEQMMTPEARKAVVDAWARAFEIAIKRNTDKKSQEFFNKVFDFLDNPSKESFDAATNIMPSYDFYQYMNPSEYWAVNAEKLMAAKLGTPWARFVSAVKKLLEALKSVFGVNNTFTVHKEFDNIINGKLERTKGTRDMLIDYLLQGKIELDFLNSIEDVNDLLDKHSRSDAPRKPSPSVRDAFMGGYENTKETVKDVLTSPLLATNNMIGKADRALTYFRNKNIFFGYGLEEADRQRYGGQIRNAHKQAIASVAVVNALHSGNIATQVMTLGKLEFDPDIQMFVATKSDKSMANVVREKAKLIDKLGFDTGNRVIQAYFEAKRSRSIVNEYLKREGAYVAAIEDGQNQEEAGEDLANIEAAIKKVNMDDEAIDDFIALENQYPELKNMMDNWTAVNKNMVDMMEFSGIISKQRAKALRNIKDYVPWYRIMDEQEDVHSAPKGTRGLTNVAADKKFGPGKTDRDIDDIVDNMIHNVLTITRNSARNYAANRIVMEYGERYKEGKKAGKLRIFPKDGSDADGVRFNIIANGRRIVVRIQDPLVAESVIGMENIDIPMNGALAFMANTLRRSITTFPAFQVAQLFMDAPTAALVTGLKRPDKVWAGVFTSFLKNVRNDDPIVAKLRAAGIGGYQSSARTPEKEIQLDIGLIQGSWFSKAMKGLDRFGDASDYAQRRSVYLQTMKETNDEMLALFQANNVIDFKKRGSGQIAQLLTRQVAFMNAYAQAIDVLAKGLAGTGLKGIERKKAFGRMVVAGMMLASATIVYCMLVGDDDEYNKLDDQTKMRNIFIPGLNIRLPMHSGAAFFFKAIPELLYNAITKEGTKDEYDRKRLTRALSKAAADALLGPNVTPTGVKPVVEIALNRNFFTGGQVTPRGMEDLAAFRQYNQNTSELGKIISALTGTEKTRLLNPIEADHLVRGLTGTVGAAVMWGTNLLAGDRPTPQARENPLYGQFIMPDVPRGREDLYYDLKSKTDEAYKTYMDLQKKGRREEAADWFKDNKKLIQVYGYTSSIESDLKRLNGEIRRLSDLPKEKMSPDAKRKRMTELQEIKGRMLKDVISMRKRAGFDD
jgi:GNAT superfamily N-acetyltransferase